MSKKHNVPFFSLKETNEVIKSKILAEFKDTFEQSNYILGDKVNAFEKEYADFSKVKYAVGVGNGLEALVLGLRAIGIKRGDEVIVPSNTYIATALAVSACDAIPVFVEPKLSTYNIDPDKIQKSVTGKTKAIMPVHLYGQACEMNSIAKIATKNKLAIIEDNAQAQGATYKGKTTGSMGIVNATSFYPTKNLGALGDAGAITTNDKKIYEKVRMLRNYGSEKKYYHDIIGYNSRLDEVQAGFLSIKLKYLEKWNKERIAIADLYTKALSDIKDLVLPLKAEGASHVYHQYVIRTKKRDELQAYLKEAGIGTMIHYPVPLHLQKAYLHLGHKKGHFPIAEEISATCLSLPLYPGLKKDKIEYVAAVIKKKLKK